MPTISTQTALQSGYAQLRLQQAKRNAERAEQTAQALGQQARIAQVEADRAQESARALSVQSDRADARAGEARQGLAAIRSASEAVSRLGAIAERTVQNANAAAAAPLPEPPNDKVAIEPAAPATAVNAQGQATGKIVSVTA